MPTFYPGQTAASYLAALNALANNGSMAVIDAPQTYTAIPTFGAGATVASGQTLTLTGATVAGAPTWSSSQAITLSTAAQPNITSTGALNAGSITSGFGSINVGANSISGGAATFVSMSSQIPMNPSTISADVTVPSGYNAYSAGPLTIGEGVNITLADNSQWSVL